MKLPKDLYKKVNYYPVRIFITPRGHLYHKVGLPNLSVFTVQPDNDDDYSVWEQPLLEEEIQSAVDHEIEALKAERQAFAFGPHPFYTYLKTDDRLKDLEYKIQLIEGRVL
jgi:hypothetical protein